MLYGRKRHSKKGNQGAGRIILGVIGIMALCCSYSVGAERISCGRTFIYEGQGAGRVVFDGNRHLSGGLSCADCHEAKGFSGALFKMEKGANDISMRKMELGRSCGSCHQVSMKDTLHCALCHQK